MGFVIAHWIDGIPEAAHWQVLPDLDRCTAERREILRQRPGIGLTDFALRWLSGGESSCWFVAVAEHGSIHRPRREVAQYMFRASADEAVADIAFIRERYAKYAATVRRFVVCEAREARP